MSWAAARAHLARAHDELSEAQAAMQAIPRTEHITDNLQPVLDAVARFRDLAAQKEDQ